MRRISISVATTFLCVMPMLSAGFASCGGDDPDTLPDTGQATVPEQPGDDDGNNNGNDNNENNEEKNEMNRNMTIRVSERSFTATLEDNPTARAFTAMLPLTLNMPDMNGNEKYYYLTDDLPTAASHPGTLQAGDLMLYGSSCLVLFYESFRTSYSYTRIGRVDNASGLAAALGSSSVNVTFEVNNNQ